MTNKIQEEIQKMDFETAFNALQQNINELESEDLPLEKSLALFERGQALAKHCTGLLEAAELKIRQLSTDEIQPSATEG